MTSSTVPAGPAASRSRGLAAEGRALASLRHAAFRTLLGSNMALQVGSWVQTIGQGWLVVHDLGGSASNLATVALLRGASLVLISPIGGYLAGRFDRRNQLLLYNGVAAAVACALGRMIDTWSAPPVVFWWGALARRPYGHRGGRLARSASDVNRWRASVPRA